MYDFSIPILIPSADERNSQKSGKHLRFGDTYICLHALAGESVRLKTLNFQDVSKPDLSKSPPSSYLHPMKPFSGSQGSTRLYPSCQ